MTTRPGADQAASPISRPIAWLRAMLGGDSDASITNRLAGIVFAIRIISAGLAYVVQILLARWMDGSNYGTYVYVWTWVLLLGSMLDLGVGVGAQKLIPEYRTRGDLDALRGFLSGSRWLTLAASSAVALLLAAIVWLITPWLDPATVVPLYIGCTILPPFVVANTQDGIARSYDWIPLAQLPQFIVRQTLIIGFVAGLLGLGLGIDASAGMAASSAAVWLAMAGQFLVLNRRLAGIVPRGSKTHHLRGWVAVSLPIMMVEGFYLLLSYSDVLLLQQFRPAAEVGLYFAVIKTVALISFVHFAMAATTAHRFATYHANGDHDGLAAYVGYASRWTFWPTVAATIVLLIFGKPLLWLFGPQFVAGYDIMFIAVIGLVVRAATGPVERLLNMLGHQYLCALAYALAFAANAALCLVLIPDYGAHGAAAATSLALSLETALLFWMAKRAIGLNVLAFGSGRAP
jgi:O-antigen/teichoic acid export membrane protein